MIENNSKNKLLKQSIPAWFPTLIDIYHESEGHFRYNDTGKDFVFEGEVWEPEDFAYSRPEFTDSGVGNGMLSLPCIDQTWIVRVRRLQPTDEEHRFHCRLVGLMCSYNSEGDVKTEILRDEDYVLSEASWKDEVLSWNMILDDKWNIIIPCVSCNATVAYGVS